MKLRRAFTLVELLAVMAVIAIVIAFAVPAATQIMKGSQLTQGSQQFADQIGYARSLAISKNRPIEVRFYRFSDPETPGEDVTQPKQGKWRAFQLFEQLENGAILPVGPMHRLPRMVIMDGDKYSTLISEKFKGQPEDASTDKTAPELPVEVGERKVGRQYEYVHFKFLPDGSTDLPPRAKEGTGIGTDVNDDSWYVTLVNLTDENRSISTVNYYILQIDAISGTIKSYRPNAG
jgi:uncharacterized protein (TIGR02596 family)